MNMDFNLTMGIIYIFAIALSTLGAGMLVMLKIGKVISFNSKNTAVLFFLISVFMLSLLYFIIDYYSHIMNNSGWSAIVRVMDIWLCLLLNFCALAFVKCSCFPRESGVKWKAVVGAYIIVFIADFINYGFLLDDKYQAKGLLSDNISIILQCGQAVIILVIYIVFMVKVLFFYNKSDVSGDIRLVSIVLLIVTAVTGLQNTYYGVLYIANIIDINGQEMGRFDLTAVILLVLAVIMLWYVIRHCFISVYNKNYNAGDANKEKMTAEQALFEIAVDSQLTAREKDIMVRLYRGDTYQRIADEIYISKNTVKRHVASVYKKTGMSSKIDLINLVREIQMAE